MRREVEVCDGSAYERSDADIGVGFGLLGLPLSSGEGQVLVCLPFRVESIGGDRQIWLLILSARAEIQKSELTDAAGPALVGAAAFAAFDLVGFVTLLAFFLAAVFF